MLLSATISHFFYSGLEFMSTIQWVFARVLASIRWCG